MPPKFRVADDPLEGTFRTSLDHGSQPTIPEPSGVVLFSFKIASNRRWQQLLIFDALTRTRKRFHATHSGTTLPLSVQDVDTRYLQSPAKVSVGLPKEIPLCAARVTFEPG